MSEKTIRESTIEDIELTERVIALGTVSDFYAKRLTKLKADLAWYDTDETRPCWTITNLFEIPVTYNEYGAWDDWLDDVPETERDNIIIEEGKITGRECGDLMYFDP